MQDSDADIVVRSPEGTIFMIRPEFKQILMDQRGAAVILWSCFMISIVIYIVIAEHVLANPRFSRGVSGAENLRLVLWALAVIDLGYYVYWKKRYLAPQAMIAESSKTKLLRALEEHKGEVERRAAAVVSTYVTRKVVLFAIIEAIAVYGLVLALVGHYLPDQYLLSGLSLLLLAFEFPSEKSLKELVLRVETVG
jgi:hypothetical protein